MPKGFFAIILHAHLPFVRHPEGQELAEDWLYEAITETYIPLLNIMYNLLEKDVDFRLTINISPVLANMLSDDLIQNKYLQHLDKLIELSEKEVIRTRNNPAVHHLAQLYQYLFKETKYIFTQKHDKNILQGFKKLQDSGNVEIITSAATHGYLPLLLTKNARNAQITTGIKSYENCFDQKPRGFWLPECGYKDGVDKLLAGNDIKYFITSSHGLLYAKPRPRYGVFAPIYTPDGVAAFGRDIESSKQVWSADEGYPGDYNYREFYRDIGYELDYEYIKPYLNGEKRKHVGIKYHKITGKTENKDIYIPENAREKAAEHAGNFIFNRQQQIKYLNQIMERKPIIVAPYDAELFGHWWFEGPQWLKFLLEKIHFDQQEIETITLTEYLQKYPKNQISLPAESSWGYRGYHEVWLNGSNDWIYRHLHEAELKMVKLTEENIKLRDRENIIYRSLNQLSRELLLAESSDWAFIIKANTMVDYAQSRIKEHLENFFELAEQIANKKINYTFLHKLENKNNIFPEIDFKIYDTKDLLSRQRRLPVSI